MMAKAWKSRTAQSVPVRPRGKINDLGAPVGRLCARVDRDFDGAVAAAASTGDGRPGLICQDGGTMAKRR